MKIGKIKPQATVVAQFAGGVEVEAIQHEGKIFLPVFGLGDFSEKESAPVAPSTPKKDESKKSAPKNDEEKESSYTEEELMEMSTKELLKICKEEFDINPDDFDGKNTNKKLRNLILEAQEGDDEDADEEEEEDDAKDADNDKDSDDNDEEDNLVDRVADIIEDFDGGKKNKKKTITAIVALSDTADADRVTELVEKFEDDEEADIDELAQEIVDSFTPSKKKSRKSKKSKDEDLVDVKDLKVGDRVSVYWADDNEEWFDGEVKSIKKGKVTIAYDDDTEDLIDPKIHTKIKLLAD